LRLRNRSRLPAAWRVDIEIKNNMSNNLETIRHSLSHLLAAAVMDLWPGTKRAIGPAIDNGFYFDFEFKKPISEDDVPKIEKKMREILPTWDTFTKVMLSPAEAKKEYPDNPYKHELIDEFSKGKKKVSFYKSGEYQDLCAGGHVKSMKEIKPDSFKLTKITGAYWRGDEKNKMLTRIYGVAFEDKPALKKYLQMMEQAKKRDHKILGPKLDLFVFNDLVGPGLPLWTPKGNILREVLSHFVWQLRKNRNYEQVEIPHITKKELFETSGHWDKFSDELFRIKSREGHDFAMKPMNCPFHTQIYDRKPQSYRDLPQRYASTTMCYRDEQTGELSGLLRLRAFTQDDAHVFCRKEQIAEEFNTCWDIVDEFYSAFGFELLPRLSVSDPENMQAYLGEKKDWKHAEDVLRRLAKERKVDAPEQVGEAAFYGPKIDFVALDSIGREWQVATIQLDMNMPERFDLTCTNEKGKDERIVMVHCAVMGAIERFLSILIEHTAGEFPAWLAPVQVALLPVSTEKHLTFSERLADEFREQDARVWVDESDETIGKKVRNAEQQKIPYILVIGEKEMKGKKLTVRKHGDKDTVDMELDDVVKNLQR
jgi:threonyl-tRNA synthetase